jgi:phosphatidate cytidylyltransferase
MSDVATAAYVTSATPFVAGALGISGLAVLRSRRRELVRRWTTWLVTAPLVGGAFLLGRPAVAALAAVLGAVGAWELARLWLLPRADRLVLMTGAVAAPVLAVTEPSWLGRTAIGVPLLAAVPALLDGDAERGATRATRVAFGLLWLGALSGLVLLGGHAFALVLAVSVADVGAWCAGKALRGPRLSALSPDKRLAGLLGGAAAGALVLWLLGALSWPLLLAVAIGAPAGDLLESMLKRGAGVKDTGTWLPGFGGLLDRVDSLLVALVVALVLS